MKITFDTLGTLLEYMIRKEAIMNVVLGRNGKKVIGVLLAVAGLVLSGLGAMLFFWPGAVLLAIAGVCALYGRDLIVK